MTVKEAVTSISKDLADKGISSALLDAQLIVGNAASMSRAQILAYPDKMLSDIEKAALNIMYNKRANRMPMQYILGKCEFMGLDFVVNEHTLIPRNDTETVVENAIDIIKSKNYKTVLDIGTGSGAIAVSIAKYTDAYVAAADISEKAIETAKINAENNNVNIDFIHSDIFSDINENYDVIISNPPYIESDVIKTLEPEVKEFEPINALDGGKDGLFFYRRIIEECKYYLNDKGAVIFEIGYNQGEEVKKLLEINNFDEIYVKNDLSGLNRVVIGFKMC